MKKKIQLKHRDFANDKLLYNDTWISNGHWMLRRIRADAPFLGKLGSPEGDTQVMFDLRLGPGSVAVLPEGKAEEVVTRALRDTQRRVTLSDVLIEYGKYVGRVCQADAGWVTLYDDLYLRDLGCVAGSVIYAASPEAPAIDIPAAPHLVSWVLMPMRAGDVAELLGRYANASA